MTPRDNGGRATPELVPCAAPELDSIPAELQRLGRWLLWRNEANEEDPTKPPRKVPYGTALRYPIDATDPKHWSSFAQVRQAYENGAFGLRYSGVGIGLGKLAEYPSWLIALDLDACLDADGKPQPWAQQLFEWLKHPYAEVSPSGAGVKLFLVMRDEDMAETRTLLGIGANKWGRKISADVAHEGAHGPGVEIYLGRRYFTCTGRRWPGAGARVEEISLDLLKELATLLPTGGKGRKGRKKRDESGSARAWRRGLELIRSGAIDATVEALRAALLADDDPEIVRWTEEKGDDRQIERIIEGAAADDAAESDKKEDNGRRVIKIRKGMLHRLADAAESAILSSGLPIYQRGVLVRPTVSELDAADGGRTQIAALHALGVAHLLDLFCRTAAWKQWSGNDGWVPSDPPENVARILLARAGQWQLPQLRGILGIPTLRRDGSLLLTPGYDPASGYYLALPPELRLPAISDEPEQSECVAALKLLDDLLVEFPFVDLASRSVGLSLLITAVIRPAMIVAPIHAASSPTRGTGKSFLFDLAGGVVYGDRVPVLFAGKGPEELEKKLNGQLLQGTGLFSLDNLNIALEGDLVCQVATQALLDLRRLGKSDIFRTPNSALLCACGNNLAVHDDLNRRVVMAWMDAGVERPELRAFKADPFATVIQDRGKYIAAVLTVVRGYLAVHRFAGVEVTPLAGFDQYTRLVREPLVWLGRADPARSMDALHAADRVLNELISVMAAWEGAVGLNQEITVAAVMQGIANPPIPKRETRPDLTHEEYRKLITDIAARWTDLGAAITATMEHGGKATAAAIGYWLRRYSKRITNGRKFMSRAGHGGVMHWWLAG